jgi:4-diphosphocytidyl-2-C-methyl-D-erythritol kinase
MGQAVDEVRGAVERIDDPGSPPRASAAAGFFGHDDVVGESIAQPGDDDFLGRAVGFGDQVDGRLALDIFRLFQRITYQRAGITGQGECGVDGGGGHARALSCHRAGQPSNFASMPPDRSVEYRAPAKVNLALRVLGRRTDGYHELESIMVPVSLYDRVRIDVRRQSTRRGITCKVSGAASAPSGPENLAWKAADLVLQALGMRPRVDIAICKRIPSRAGLGGGSSDAAVILRHLPALLGRRIPVARAGELALQLGADVPFFLTCRPCVASGIGEVLEPLVGFPRLALVIAVPPTGVETAWAYRNALPPEATRPLGRGIARRRTLRVAGLQLSIERILSRLSNDFESGVSGSVADVGRVRNRLTELGAVHTVMSGSGSAMVGVFSSPRHARAAARDFGKGDRVFAVSMLAGVPAAKSIGKLDEATGRRGCAVS